MTAARPDRRVWGFRVLTALSGILLMASAIGAEWLLGRELDWDAARIARLGIGVALLGVVWVLPARRVSATVFQSSAALALILLTVAALEVGFRVAAYPFTVHVEALKQTPPFYRRPSEPVCDVFFRRPGPDQWSGQVLATQLRSRGAIYEGYDDEPEITVRYDRDGFRNPPGLNDWDIVVVGDSFTELGYLVHEDLFTTRLGALLGVRVRNLSASYTGPFTYPCYLRQYGRAPSARYAVVVFAEASDFRELAREDAAVRRYAETGEREDRSVEPHSSLIRAASDWLALSRRRRREKSYQNSVLQLDGRSVPFLANVDPYAPDEDDVALLDEALSQWAADATSLGMKPWLLFMPSKHRVYRERIRILEGSDHERVVKEPLPHPDLLERLSAKHGIEYVDATPALRRHAARGELLFNPVYDAHLNREGSQVVGDLLAERLRRAGAGSPGPSGS